MSLQFKDVAAAALANYATLLPEWIGGRLHGREWKGERRANGGPGDSWSVNVDTGHWLHGGGDERGLDLVSLFAALHHIDSLAALPQVGAQVGMVNGKEYVPKLLAKAPPREPEHPCEAIPDDPPPIGPHPKHGIADVLYRYGDQFVVARWDTPSGKTFSQYTWRGRKWHNRGHPGPLQIYGRHLIFRHKDVPVVIVEGEKCADAAQVLRAICVITWAGGAGAAHKTDWAPLKGREVIIWPDADEPGAKAAAELANIAKPIAKSVRIISPAGKPPAWDIADALNEMTQAEIYAFIKERSADLPTAADLRASADLPTAAELTESAAAPAPTRSNYVDWRALGLDSNQSGIPHPTLANASLIIQGHQKFRGQIWMDTFRGKIFHTLHGGAPRLWDHESLLMATVFIQQAMRLNQFSTSLVAEAIEHAAWTAQRNSLTDWLDSLVWDGTPRLSDWLCDTLGVVKTDYTMAVSRNWPIGMIARAYVPGCKMDNMPVLEGTHGLRKSTFLDVLGGEWYKSVTTAFGDKDFLQALQGAWLVEIPDMAGFGRREHSHVLATLATRVDSYRKSYGRYVEEVPRVSVFAATSESSDYLSDLRGRRRYWPLSCTEIDIDALRQMREQIFAEARLQYRAGEHWYDMPETADFEQRARAEPDLWTDKVMEYCENLWGERQRGARIKIQSARILSDALEIPLGKQSLTEKVRIARILRDNNWVQSRTSTAREWIKVERKQ